MSYEALEVLSTLLISMPLKKTVAKNEAYKLYGRPRRLFFDFRSRFKTHAKVPVAHQQKFEEWMNFLGVSVLAHLSCSW